MVVPRPLAAQRAQATCRGEELYPGRPASQRAGHAAASYSSLVAAAVSKSPAAADSLCLIAPCYARMILYSK